MKLNGSHLRASFSTLVKRAARALITLRVVGNPAPLAWVPIADYVSHDAAWVFEDNTLRTRFKTMQENVLKLELRACSSVVEKIDGAI